MLCQSVVSNSQYIVTAMSTRVGCRCYIEGVFKVEGGLNQAPLMTLELSICSWMSGADRAAMRLPRERGGEQPSAYTGDEDDRCVMGPNKGGDARD